WCSQYGRPSYAYSCAFSSWEQCWATVWGIGGYCYQNPYPPPALARPTKSGRRGSHSLPPGPVAPLFHLPHHSGDGVSERGKLLRRDGEGGREIDRGAERPYEYALGHEASAQRVNVVDTVDLDDPDRALHPHVAHPRYAPARREPLLQRGRDGGDLR